MRTLLAIIIAGIVGSLATFVAVNLLAGIPLEASLTRWGAYIVAILVVATFPFIYAAMNPVPAGLVCLIVGTVVPAVLANTVFLEGDPTPWLPLLGFNAVFALVALVVYNLIAPIPDPI